MTLEYISPWGITSSQLLSCIALGWVSARFCNGASATYRRIMVLSLGAPPSKTSLQPQHRTVEDKRAEEATFLPPGSGLAQEEKVGRRGVESPNSRTVQEYSNLAAVLSRYCV